MARRILWLNKNGDPEKIEGKVWTAGKLRIQITKVLSAGAGKTGGLWEIEDPGKIEDTGKIEDPEKRGGNLFRGVRDPGLKYPLLELAFRIKQRNEKEKVVRIPTQG